MKRNAHVTTSERKFLVYHILKPSGYFVFCTTKLNTRKSQTVYLCVSYVSEYKQQLFVYTELIDWFFVTETECVYCAVRTGLTCNIYLPFKAQWSLYVSPV